MTILPIIKKFEDNKKIKKILLTSSTTSSASIIKRQNLKKTTHAYYPFDIGFICNNFLKRWKPKIAIFVDSEIWPSMYERLYLKKIPIILINGRITKKSFERWNKIPSFANNIFSKISIALPQNIETRDYLNRLGVKKIKYIGNLKYFKNDKSISKAKIKKYFKNKLVFCAASTHYDEEIVIARLHLDLKRKFKNLLTIIIPRHINRSEDIIKDLKNLKLKVIKRSNGLKRSNDCDVLIVDTYGEMSNFLELSNLAFIGGSIINHGGQNPLEAVRMGNYVMHGEKIDNFKEIYNELKNYKISSQVKNISEMKRVFVKKYNYKKSKNKIKRIHNLGSRIFKENAKKFKIIYNEYERPVFWDSFNLISFILIPLSLLTIIYNFIKSFSSKKYFKIKTICVGNIY